MMQTEKRGAMQAILYGLFIGLTYALVGFNAFISLAALLLKLEYQLIHKLLWLACVCAVLSAALLFCRIGKKSASPLRGHAAAVYGFRSSSVCGRFRARRRGAYTDHDQLCARRRTARPMPEYMEVFPWRACRADHDTALTDLWSYCDF